MNIFWYNKVCSKKLLHKPLVGSARCWRKVIQLGLVSSWILCWTYEFHFLNKLLEIEVCWQFRSGEVSKWKMIIWVLIKKDIRKMSLNSGCWNNKFDLFREQFTCFFFNQILTSNQYSIRWTLRLRLNTCERSSSFFICIPSWCICIVNPDVSIRSTEKIIDGRFFTMFSQSNWFLMAYLNRLRAHLYFWTYRKTDNAQTGTFSILFELGGYSKLLVQQKLEFSSAATLFLCLELLLYQETCWLNLLQAEIFLHQE